MEHTSRRHRVPGPDGTFEEVEVHTSEAVVDDDLDDIAAAYHAWLTQQMTPARGRGAQGPAT